MDAIGYVRSLGVFVGAWAVICALLGAISSPAYLGVVWLGLTIIFAIGFFALLMLVGLAVYVLVNGTRRPEVRNGRCATC